ncbi:MAG: O-antigen ligase family protein [Thermoguttaceae bacterium]
MVWIVGAVLLVWGAVVFVRGGLLGGCLLVLLSGCAFGPPLLKLPTQPIPLTVDRVLWVLLVAQYALWRRLGLAAPKPPGREDLAGLLFLGFLAASTLTHDWQAHNHLALSRLLFYYVMPAGLYWVARQSPLSPGAVRSVWFCLAAFGVYLSATAICEVCGAWWLVEPGYIAAEGEFFGRARGPLLNPAGNGIFMAAGLSALLLAWPWARRAGRLPLAALLGLYLAGLGATLTRSVWLGAGLCLCVLAAPAVPRRWRLPALATALVAVSVLLAAHLDALVAFKRDQGLSAQATADSVRLRPILARVAWNMFLDRPLVGCGFGQYSDQCVDYLHDRSTDLPLGTARHYVQHNVWLALLTETGLVGAGLFSILLWLWTANAWRLWHSGAAPPWARRQGLLWLALLGMYLPCAMFQDASLIPMVNMLLFFVAGVTMGLARQAWPEVAEVRPPP